MHLADKICKTPFGEGLYHWTIETHSFLHSYPERIISSEAKGDLIAHLLHHLSQQSGKALLLELIIFKMYDSLEGSTPKERFSSFINNHFLTAEFKETFFKTNPVLSHRFNIIETLWKLNTKNFLTRLEQDLPEIQKEFSPNQPLGNVVHINTGLSDFHLGNQNVFEVTFESGLSIFYKPRTIKGDLLFRSFLEDLHKLGFPLTFKIANGLDKTHYCWVEKIVYLPCETEDQVKSYYRRAGALLCIFYLLSGRDFHHENLIAHGEYPVPIDLETLFTSNLDIKNGNISIYALENSVLGTNMLPQLEFGEKGLAGMDMSGLGGKPGQEWSVTADTWQHVNTDEMEIVVSKVSLPQEKNLVKIKDKAVSPDKYINNILSGFKECYQFLKNHQKTILEEAKLLDRFDGVAFRHIIRPTRFYGKLLMSLKEIPCLRSRKAHKETHDILTHYLTCRDNDFLTPITNEEIRALDQMDFPIFQSFPDQPHLYSEGKLILKNAFSEPAKALILKKFRGMSRNDCEQQIRYIKEAFASVYFEANVPHASLSRSTSGFEISDSNLIAEAECIAETIFSKGHANDLGGMHWLALEFIPSSEQIMLKPLSYDLYGGEGGLALFFAALYHCTNKPYWHDAAKKTIHGITHTLKLEDSKRLPGAIGLGGMTGVGSLIYILCRLGDLIPELNHLDDALKLFNLITLEHIQSDRDYDLIAGSAGLILSLVALYKKTHETKVLEKAQLTAQHLQDNIQNMPTGIGWKNDIGFQPMLGFSHGVAGIAYALEKLSEISGNQRWNTLANQALQYERSNYLSEQKNWPDFREPNKTVHPVQWCHGATGIGLGRLFSPNYHNDSQRHEEVQIALETTISSLPHTCADHCCCGYAGKATFILSASHKLKRPDLKNYAENEIAKMISHSKEHGGYHSSPLLPRGTFAPGFMQGTAGVGYTLLQLTEQGKNLPQILVLE